MNYRPSPTKPISVEHHSTSSGGTPNPTYYRPSKPGSHHEVTTPSTRGPGVETSSHSSVFDTNQGGSGHVPCGTVPIANPLITHGQKTHRGQWPWHTALYKTEGINLNYLCGGSLVAKNKVITGE